MVEASNPQLGIIADSTLQRHIVCQAVQSAGYEIKATLSPDKVDAAMMQSDEFDLWWIEIEDENKWSEFIDQMFETAKAPILVGDGQAPSVSSRQYPRWERRVYAKIKDIVGRPRSANATFEVVDLEQALIKEETPIVLPPELHNRQGAGEPAEYIWVLGASLGGPKAVKEFLDALPAGLPVAFVIAQHIDAGFQKTLEQVWSRNNSFVFIDAVEGNIISNGEIIIAPVEQVMSITANSTVKLFDEEWEGPYAPSIDQTMNLMLDNLGERTAAILFSGMGNDGAIAGPRMQAAGVQVWAQSAETCACSSQPDSARSTGCVTFSGSPRALAEHMVEHAKNFLDFSGTSARING